MRILFEFAGGPLDGKTTTGLQGDQSEAERYFLLTDHGRIGQRFKVASAYAVDLLSQEAAPEERPRRLQTHHYRVTDRLEGGDEVLVRAEYVPPVVEDEES